MPAVAGCCTAPDVDISPGNLLLLRLSVWFLQKDGIYSKEMKNKSRNLKVFHLLMFMQMNIMQMNIMHHHADEHHQMNILEGRRLWQVQPDFLPSLGRIVEVITKEMVLLKSLMDSCKQ